MAGQMTHNAVEGWRGYFEELRAQLTHYALLSELLNVELLCLGSGVSNSIPTGSVVDGHGRSIAGLQLAKRNGWNDVLTRVRAAYSGALTYGADLGKGEHRRVEFWGQLDFVGIELWKPLVRLAPGEPDPTDARLQKELMRQLRQVALAGGLAVEGEPGRAPLPVLLLGVGFPSSHDAWQRPSVPMGERDLERQVQLYEHLVYAMGKVYTDQGFAQPEGLFVHAWSAHPAAGGAWDRGHALQGKPALEAVRALFELP